MPKTKERIIQLIELNAGAMKFILDGINEDNVHNRPAENCNSAHFIFGHMINSRVEMVKILGAEASHPWGEIFSYGAKIKESSPYPPLKELQEVWDDATKKLKERLDEITVEELDAEGPFEIKPLPKTIGGCISFLIFHESYHIGQIGYLRRFLGLDAAFG
ncbi:MAG: DinB family protein [candidate division Zixibacteria bacterium]|nr:DinB family protein [candidate division Zixibacteria bacterium]